MITIPRIGTTRIPKDLIRKAIKFDDECIQLATILGKGTGENIIKIIKAESTDFGRRMAFIQTTKEAAKEGADYSKCKTIKDMSKVYARYLINKAFRYNSTVAR